MGRRDAVQQDCPGRDRRVEDRAGYREQSTGVWPQGEPSDDLAEFRSSRQLEGRVADRDP
jgi:hypothetical protein